MSDITIKLSKASAAIDAQWMAKAPDNIIGYGDTVADALHQLAFQLEYRDIEPDPPKITLEQELIKKVTRYEELKAYVREKDAIKKLIKPSFEGEPLVEVGGFDVTGHWVDRDAYDVPPCRYWMWYIKPNLKRLSLSQ